jgi:hypothetical protein
MRWLGISRVPLLGVVLINVNVVGEKDPAPLHWRVGTWGKPPLDVALDQQGQLVGFQFVLQDEQVPVRELRELPPSESGAPRFDIENWPTARYLDVSSAVMVHRTTEGELVLHLGDEPIERGCRLGPDLSMGFTAVGALTEIRLGPLPLDDWEAIDAFSLADT